MPGNLPADQHIGDVLARQQVEQRLAFAHMGVADDQPGHRAAQGVLGTRHLAWLLVVGIGNEGEVAGLFGGTVDAVINGRHHQVGEPGHEHTDFLAFAQLQARCLGVRPVIQLFGQCTNARYHFGRGRSLDPGRVAIEYPGHRGHMHAQCGRHGFQGGRARWARHGGEASNCLIFSAQILPERACRSRR